MAALLVGAIVAGYKMTPTDTPCVAIEYVIEDQAERLYVTDNELNALLRTNSIYPVGKALNALSLNRIENAVRHHPMVRTAECFLTVDNIVIVRLTQRVPLLRVKTPIETYLIDTDRKVMQAREVVKDKVPVAAGNVGQQMASTQLADFAEWLKKDTYWPTRIHHLQVLTPRMVHIYLTGENQPRVILGTMSGYEQKLNKLRTFLEQGKEATKDKHYDELDIRFKGQVVGRILEPEKPQADNNTNQQP